MSMKLRKHKENRLKHNFPRLMTYWQPKHVHCSIHTYLQTLSATVGERSANLMQTLLSGWATSTQGETMKWISHPMNTLNETFTFHFTHKCLYKSEDIVHERLEVFLPCLAI